MADWAKEFLVEYFEFYWSVECIWKKKLKYDLDRVTINRFM